MQHPSSGTSYKLAQTARLSQTQRLGLDPRQIPYQKYLKMSVQDLSKAINEMLTGENINPALEKNTPNKLSSKAVEEKRWGLRESSFYASDDASDKYQQFIENSLTTKSTLKEHLLLQLHVQPLDQHIIEAGELIIGNLDNRGFFQRRNDGSVITPYELLKSSGCHLSNEELSSLLHLISQFDPIGTCVADEKESLIVQAKITGGEPPYFYEFMSQDVKTLQNSSPETIAKKIGATPKELDAIKKYLHNFNPNPGHNYTEEVEYVIPDLEIYFEKENEGDDFYPVVKIENGFYDGLGISKEYTGLLQKNQNDEQGEVVAFVKEQVNQAKLFLEMIEYRQNSLRAIGKTIALEQKEFFLKGPKFLKSISQKKMSLFLHIDESKFSRLISGKTIKTKWGLFPLKYFFSNGGVVSPYKPNELISPNAVKAHIKEIMMAHSSKKTLSSEKISKILKGKGIDISRRTVAKYRNNLNITSSS